MKKVLLLLIAGITVFQFWVALFVSMDPFLHNAVFMCFMIAVSFLTVAASPSTTSKQKTPIIDWIHFFLMLGIGVLIIVNSERFLTRWPGVDPLNALEVVSGTLLILLIFEITRRTLGAGMLLIAVLLTAYALFGHHLQGAFSHQKITVVDFVDQMAYTMNGVFGAIASVAATYVFFFVLFGNIFNAAGGGDFFYALSKAITGRVAGGPAKVAVISSGLYGSISGSPVADVATTGSFTIPSMKKVGYSPIYAGAIEATAATGGSILPPVMGSAAFLMAELTGIPYSSIAFAAIVPGLLYYLAVFLQVHFQAKRHHFSGYDDEIPTIRGVFKSRGQFVLPIIVLVVFLALGYTPVFSAIAALAATILVSYIKKDTRLTPKKLMDTLIETVRRISPLVAVCASAGLVAGAISVTGLGGKFSTLIHNLSGGSLFLTLLVTMIVCVIFGMGMPTPAAYILTAVLTGPIMVEVGIPLLQAHLFIVYYACMSAITPPVAVAAYAAAAIADANPMKIGLLACRMGIVAFIIPFMFVYEPALILKGSVGDILVSTLTAAIGVLVLAAGFEGWFGKNLRNMERFILIISGLLMIYPNILTSILGFLCAALVCIPKIPVLFRDIKMRESQAGAASGER